MNENVIGKEAVDAAVQVHRDLGPGLPEENLRVLVPWRETRMQAEATAPPPR